MNELISKFEAVAAQISQERGDLLLFGLFLREESPGKWDVVVSARWVGEHWKPALDYVVKKIYEHIHLPDLLSVSRVVILKPSDEFVKNFNEFLAASQGQNVFQNLTFNGMQFSHIYVLASEHKHGNLAPAR